MFLFFKGETKYSVMQSVHPVIVPAEMATTEQILVSDYSRYTNLLLTEFEGRTGIYGSSFFLLRFMAQAQSAWAINQRGKNEDP